MNFYKSNLSSPIVAYLLFMLKNHSYFFAVFFYRTFPFFHISLLKAKFSFVSRPCAQLFSYGAPSKSSRFCPFSNMFNWDSFFFTALSTLLSSSFIEIPAPSPMAAFVVVVAVDYPIPSEGWGHGRRPRSPTSRATLQGLDPRSYRQRVTNEQAAQRVRS